MTIQWKNLPYWLKGVTICFIIFIASTFCLYLGLENAYKRSSQPNIDLVYMLPLLVIYFILLPVTLIGSIILSFFFKKKDVQQFTGSYLKTLVLFVLAGIGFTFSLQYFFPVTFETNVQACSLQKNHVLAQHCYVKHAIKAKDPSICNKIDNLYNTPASKEFYKNWCYERVERGYY